MIRSSFSHSPICSLPHSVKSGRRTVHHWGVWSPRNVLELENSDRDIVVGFGIRGFVLYDAVYPLHATLSVMPPLTRDGIYCKIKYQNVY
jgi:hypothetical protein